MGRNAISSRGLLGYKPLEARSLAVGLRLPFNAFTSKGVSALLWGSQVDFRPLFELFFVAPLRLRWHCLVFNSWRE